jgi:DNA-binding CsgD family transcriptional regulator
VGAESGADHPAETGLPADDSAYGRLRPLERTVLHRLQEGMGYDDLARRLHRESSFVEFVEAMALYKLDHREG